MNNETKQQWKKREGYGGPESFPEKELTDNAIGQSAELAGRKYSLYLSDKRVLHYTFIDGNALTVKIVADHHDHEAENCRYYAKEPVPGVFFVKHDYKDNERLTSCLCLDTNQNLAAVIDGEIPAEGDDDYRVRKTHVGGCIGQPATSGEIMSPSYPYDLVGKRFVAQYGDRYAWEVIYMNKTKTAWQGLKGNPGIGDTEDFDASYFAPGVYAVSWSERAETLAAVFLYDFNERTITGHMWGYAPEFKKILQAPLGGKIVDPREYGLVHNLPDEDNTAEEFKEKNKEIVLRSHRELWSEGNFDVIDELYAEDFQCHFVGGREKAGLNGILELSSGHRKSFPDWSEEVVDIIAENDRVVARYISTGTHEGEFEGIAPTGRKVKVPEVSVYRVLNGKIVEQWGFPDDISLRQQLTGD